MNRSLVVLFVGNVKKGKSSAINALTRGFISNPSKQRETFQPILFNYKKTGQDATISTIAKTLEDIHIQNEQKRQDIAKLKKEDVVILHEYMMEFTFITWIVTISNN